MSEPELFWYERKELHNPVALVGFPSIGLVGSIATSFVARELKLDVIGGMTFTDTQQYALIQNGVPYPPIRIYGGPIPRPKKKKKTEEVSEKPAESTAPEKKRRVKARDLVVITTELAPKPEQTYQVAKSVLGLLGELGITDVIFIDGIANTEGASVLGAYSNETVKQTVTGIGITPMDDGLLRGLSGAALYQSRLLGTNMMCIIAPASPQLPDPRAAAAAIGPLSKLIPRFDLDPAPLIREAEEIENRVRAQQNQQSTVNHNIYG